MNEITCKALNNRLTHPKDPTDRGWYCHPLSPGARGAAGSPSCPLNLHLGKGRPASGQGPSLTLSPRAGPVPTLSPSLSPSLTLPRPHAELCALVNVAELQSSRSLSRVSERGLPVVTVTPSTRRDRWAWPRHGHVVPEGGSAAAALAPLPGGRPAEPMSHEDPRRTRGRQALQLGVRGHPAGSSSSVPPATWPTAERGERLCSHRGARLWPGEFTSRLSPGPRGAANTRVGVGA